MEKLTKKQLLSAFLIALSTTSVLADYGDRDHRDNDYRNDRRSGRRAVDTHERDRRRTRYESRFAKIDICEEIKEDLYNAEDEYYNFESNLRSQDQVISSKRSIISNRQRALSSKQASFNQLNREVSRLTDLSKQKPRLLKQEREKLQQARAEKPLAVTTLEEAKDKRDKACAGFFTGTLTSRKCRRATSARDDA